MKVEERGATSFVIGGFAGRPRVYLDLGQALTSFAELEYGAPRPRAKGDRRRPLLGRLRLGFRAAPARR